MNHIIYTYVTYDMMSESLIKVPGWYKTAVCGETNSNNDIFCYCLWTTQTVSDSIIWKLLNTKIQNYRFIIEFVKMGFYSQKYFHHILASNVIKPLCNTSYKSCSIIKLRNFVFKLCTYSKVSSRDQNELVISRGVDLE